MSKPDEEGSKKKKSRVTSIISINRDQNDPTQLGIGIFGQARYSYYAGVLNLIIHQVQKEIDNPVIIKHGGDRI